MLKDADPAYFAGVYIVCGYTDLRSGIDSLAAIITSRFHMQLFVSNTLFLFLRQIFHPNQRTPLGRRWISASLQTCGIRSFHMAAFFRRAQIFIRRAVPLADAGVCH